MRVKCPSDELSNSRQMENGTERTPYSGCLYSIPETMKHLTLWGGLTSTYPLHFDNYVLMFANRQEGLHMLL